MQRAINLIRGQDNQTVAGILCDARQKHQNDFNTIWKSQLIQAGAEDQYWDWAFKERVYGALPGAEMYAIEYDDLTQGLMLIATIGHRSWLEPSRLLIYIRYLAAAPWNRSTIQPLPAFRGVGRALMIFARQRSLELGYEGRVGLHSLSTAELFYARLGMPNYGPDPEQDDLVYFEWGRLRS